MYLKTISFLPHHLMELAGPEHLGASEEPQAPELPHDVLTHAVRKARVPLRVPGQCEHRLKHPLHVLPGVKTLLFLGFYIITHSLVHEMGISPLAKDNLDRTPVILELLLVERGEDVIWRKRVEVILHRDVVCGKTRVNLILADERP